MACCATNGPGPETAALVTELFDRVQADHVAFGVLDEGDEAVLPDGEFLLHHLAAMLRSATGFREGGAKPAAFAAAAFSASTASRNPAGSPQARVKGSRL